MGYCQGLNFLAGSFLLVMSDELAFWHIYSLLVIVFYQRRSNTNISISTLTPRTFFSISMCSINWWNSSCLKSTRNSKSSISNLFIMLQNGDSYLYPRFITLFSSILPIKLFLRVMDVFWNEKIKVIFRTALAIVRIRKDDILAVIHLLQYIGKDLR